MEPRPDWTRRLQEVLYREQDVKASEDKVWQRLKTNAGETKSAGLGVWFFQRLVLSPVAPFFLVSCVFLLVLTFAKWPSPVVGNRVQEETLEALFFAMEDGSNEDVEYTESLLLGDDDGVLEVYRDGTEIAEKFETGAGDLDGALIGYSLATGQGGFLLTEN